MTANNELVYIIGDFMITLQEVVLDQSDDYTVKINSGNSSYTVLITS